MKLKSLFMVSLGLVLLSSPVHAGRVVVKLATVAPPDSTWHQYLQEIDEQWREISNDQVQLKIYPGTLGDEADIMRRIRIGQIDAATVSSVGLSTIDPAATALHIPLAFTSYQELDYVRKRITGPIEEILKQKGLVVLNWGEGGWVRFFTKTPLQRPADLPEQKLFVWSTGDTTRAEEIWKSVGVKPIPLSSVDILPALQTGMINAYQAPPLLALANQWFAFSEWMTDMRWAPVVGATVISRRTWEKIPEELRPKLLTVTREAGLRLDARVRKQEQEAIAAMLKRGLKPVTVPPDALKEWQALTKSLYPEIRGKMIPAEYFDRALKLRDEYRAAHGQTSKTL
ncbi:MAG: TRAP transporter substrate-binding protein DctP [Acidiferrobacterales bacterium]|nr:TRAP transporter substrate-binding protein DctP [Acidiferrobacterales bacterium]